MSLRGAQQRGNLRTWFYIELYPLLTKTPAAAAAGVLLFVGGGGTVKTVPCELIVNYNFWQAFDEKIYNLS